MAVITKTIGTGKDYTTFAAWESDLDNDTPYDAADDAVGEMYNQAFSETPTINGGGTLGLNSITLRSAATDRHDGTAGTGARFTPTSGGFIGDGTTPTINIEWLEFDCTSVGSVQGLNVNTGATVNIRNCIIHSMPHAESAATCYGLRLRGSDTTTVVNTLIYDITNSGTTAVYAINSTSSSNYDFINLTVYGTANTNGTSGDAAGIANNDNVNGLMVNCLVDNTTSTSGLAEDYLNTAYTSGTSTTCGSSDATSPNSALRNQTYTFENAAGDDYRLASGSDGIDDGTDRGAGAWDGKTDLVNYDRDAGGDVWDLGAFEWQAGVTISSVTPSTWDDGDSGTVIAGTGFV